MLPIDHLSYSSVSSYLTCAMAWKFHYLDRKEAPASASLVLGGAFHESIERIIRARAAGETLDPVEVWAEEWTRASAKPVDWGGDTPQQTCQQGLRLLTHPGTLETVTSLRPLIENGEPVIERRVELQVDGVPVPVIGYIDLIADDGVPCDFKTAARAWSDGQPDKEMQPVVYLAALGQSAYVLNPELRFRHYVFTKTTTPKVQRLETTRSAAEFRWIGRVVREVWRGISAEIFPPNPGAWFCGPGRCAYWIDCRGHA